MYANEELKGWDLSPMGGWSFKHRALVLVVVLHLCSFLFLDRLFLKPQQHHVFSLYYFSPNEYKKDVELKGKI